MVILSFLLFLFAVSAAATAAVENVQENLTKKGLECEFYNGTCFSDPSVTDKSRCSGTCPLTGAYTCYTVWSNETTTVGHNSGLEVKMMGCFSTSQQMSIQDCRRRDYCLEDTSNPRGKSGHLFCCCNGDLCNSDFRWEPKSAPPSNPVSQLPHQQQPPPANLPISAAVSPSSLFLLLYIFVPVLIIFVLGVAGFVVYRQRKGAEFNSLSTSSDEAPECPQTPKLANREIQLLEIKARGRFGAVWKGMYNDRVVAVKIFPLQDKQSWFAEQEIYNLPRMDHENILQFLGVERKGENLSQEFWLTTTFHDNGSLCDYLKCNTVSWEELCKISQSMSRGLTHLHEEIPASKNQGMKPAIAHRDFKSKNVLLKADLTACIGDFGLALVFEPGKSCGDTHGQVGTRRYMAPEVLEGAINFSRDAFLRIDMYACGLVLWELVSRLRLLGVIPGEYKLPFEAETNHPTLEDMQELVVNRKIRPRIKSVWRQHAGVAALCDTIEECWDHDAEARLSASCVTERIKAMQNYSMIVSEVQTTNHVINPTTPLISERPLPLTLPLPPLSSSSFSSSLSSMSSSHPQQPPQYNSSQQ